MCASPRLWGLASIHICAASTRYKRTSRTFGEIKRKRVDAIALTRRRRTVVETVAQVRPAHATLHFLAHHAVRIVGDDFDVIAGGRLVKTGPAAAAFVLGS